MVELEVRRVVYERQKRSDGLSLRLSESCDACSDFGGLGFLRRLIIFVSAAKRIQRPFQELVFGIDVFKSPEEGSRQES